MCSGSIIDNFMSLRMLKDFMSFSVILADTRITPKSSKLIKPESKQASNVGDSSMPFYMLKRSVTSDLDQGLICDALRSLESLHPVTAHDDQ